MKLPRIGTHAQLTLLGISLILASIYGYAFVSLMGFFPLPSPSLGADDVVRLYTDHNLRFRIGIALMLITGGWFTVWSVVVALQMARDELGVPKWALLYTIGAVFQSFTLGYPPVIWGLCAFSVERSPELTLVMHQFGFLAYITPVAWYPFIIASVVMVSFSPKKDPGNSAFPRWLGWLTLWSGVSAELGFAAILFKSGPFAWNGLFPFYLPCITYAMWLSANSYTLFRAIRRQSSAELEPNLTDATMAA